ncbi:MAG TPA: hypothetical protein VIO61_11105 [Anaerolineaceae bacterium]
MDQTSESTTQPANTPLLPSGSKEKGAQAEDRKTLITIIVVAVLIIIGLIGGIIVLSISSNDTVGKVRDIFIIFMALESLVIGVALVILMIQLATLINLLQNEIKPILNSTNETVNTLKGTVTFLSDNLTEPVIVINQYIAALKKIIDVFRLIRR